MTVVGSTVTMTPGIVTGLVGAVSSSNPLLTYTTPANALILIAWTSPSGAYITFNGTVIATGTTSTVSGISQVYVAANTQITVGSNSGATAVVSISGVPG
jgi:hypothetical protein